MHVLEIGGGLHLPPLFQLEPAAVLACWTSATKTMMTNNHLGVNGSSLNSLGMI